MFYEKNSRNPRLFIKYLLYIVLRYSFKKSIYGVPMNYSINLIDSTPIYMVVHRRLNES